MNTNIILAALENDTYDPGSSDYTTTQLLRPPQMTYLAEHHEPRERDPYQKWRAFIGTAIHDWLERSARVTHPDAVLEERLYWTTMVDGQPIKIGGKPDVLFPGHMEIDFKVILVAGAPKKPKPEHYEQVQFNAFLAHQNGIEIPTGALDYIFDDWRNGRAGNPPKPTARFVFDIEPMDEIERRLVARVREHEEARKGNSRPCTDEERWKHEDQWALKRPAAKKARKLCSSEQEAQALAKTGEVIEHRPGACVRCESWCDYATHCSQFRPR